MLSPDAKGPGKKFTPYMNQRIREVLLNHLEHGISQKKANKIKIKIKATK